MRVRDLMQVAVKTVGSNAPVGDAIVTLADGHISAVPATWLAWYRAPIS